MDTNFEIIDINRDIPLNSSHIIHSLVTDQSACLMACNTDLFCNFVIFKASGICYTLKIGGLKQLVTSTEPTYVFQSQK